MKSFFKAAAAPFIAACIFFSNLRADTPIVDATLSGTNIHVTSGSIFTIDAGATFVLSGSLSGAQPSDVKLTAFSGLTPTSDTFAYFTDSTHMATGSFTAFARSLVALSTSTAFFNAIAPSTAVTSNLIYFDGTNWVPLTLGGGLSISSSTLNVTAGASSTATYITAQTEGALPNSISLGALTSGILKISVTSGVASIATATPGTDYLVPGAIGSTIEAWSANLDTWSGKTAPSGTVVGNTDTITLSSKTLASPIITGNFSPPIVSSDPGSPTDGMQWYNSTSHAMNARINGATVAWGSGGGTGNVTGAASSTTHNLVTFGDTTGKLIEDFSTITVSSSGVLTGSSGIGLTSTGANNIILTPGSGGVRIGPTTTAIVASTALQVSTSSGSTLLGIIGYGGATGFYGFASSGTSSSPTATSSGSELTYLGGGGYTGTSWHTPCVVATWAAETFTNSAFGGYIEFETTQIGTTTRTEAARISPNGNLLVGSTTDITGAAHLLVASTDDASTSSTGGARFSGGIGVAKKIISGSSILSVSNSAGVGYAAGAGGAVTQATSRTTGVTLNTVAGDITLVSAAGSTSWQTFTVTNSSVAATDQVVPDQKSGTDVYQYFISNTAAGSFKFSFATTGGTTTEQPVFHFTVVKSVNS